MRLTERAAEPDCEYIGFVSFGIDLRHKYDMSIQCLGQRSHQLSEEFRTGLGRDSRVDDAQQLATCSERAVVERSCDSVWSRWVISCRRWALAFCSERFIASSRF